MSVEQVRRKDRQPLYQTASSVLILQYITSYYLAILNHRAQTRIQVETRAFRVIVPWYFILVVLGFDLDYRGDVRKLRLSQLY